MLDEHCKLAIFNIQEQFKWRRQIFERYITSGMIQSSTDISQNAKFPYELLASTGALPKHRKVDRVIVAAAIVMGVI